MSGAIEASSIVALTTSCTEGDDLPLSYYPPASPRDPTSDLVHAVHALCCSQEDSGADQDCASCRKLSAAYFVGPSDLRVEMAMK